MYLNAGLNDFFEDKKEEILFSPMTKAPSPTEKSKKERDNTKTPCLAFLSAFWLAW